MQYAPRHRRQWEKITFRFQRQPSDEFSGIIIAELYLLGYEGFLEKEEEITAWIESRKFSPEHLHDLKKKYAAAGAFEITRETEQEENWNKRWEKNYHPVWIGRECQIRASFHAPSQDIPYDIIINPGMAFGTGHHETTRLMMEMMLPVSFSGKDVLDMGCGTGILSVLASLKGAAKVTAIDNFPNACLITKENAALNKCKNISIIEGNHKDIPERSFDIILVNITRNIIIEMLASLSDHLADGGHMILSGFFFGDRQKILSVAAGYGLKFKDHRSENSWIAVLVRKKQ